MFLALKQVPSIFLIPVHDNVDIFGRSIVGSLTRQDVSTSHLVCANTLGLAERRSKGQGVSIMYRGDLDAKLSEAQTILALATRFYQNVATNMDLARFYPSIEQLNDYFASLYPDIADSKNRMSAIRVHPSSKCGLRSPAFVRSCVRSGHSLPVLPP